MFSYYWYYNWRYNPKPSYPRSYKWSWGYRKNKNYKKKIELSKIAYTTYEKTLVELRAALRGDEFDKDDFIDRMKLIDEIIIDQSPIADRFASRYAKKFYGEDNNVHII